MFFRSLGVQPINKEVLQGTTTTISCVISGITQQLNDVKWTKNSVDVTTLQDSANYVVVTGTYGSNSQTTTLTVDATANVADTVYNCVITSNEHSVFDRATAVTLSVFS